MKFLLFFFVFFNAFAEQGVKPNPVMQFAPLIGIFVVFYFFVIRPQSKKVKQHLELVKSLKLEDNVLTQAGIFGTVKKIDEQKGQVTLEVSKGVTIKVSRTSVTNILSKNNE
jgi:preprotein translocase subunit YajC